MSAMASVRLKPLAFQKVAKASRSTLPGGSWPSGAGVIESSRPTLRPWSRILTRPEDSTSVATAPPTCEWGRGHGAGVVRPGHRAQGAETGPELRVQSSGLRNRDKGTQGQGQGAVGSKQRQVGYVRACCVETGSGVRPMEGAWPRSRRGMYGHGASGERVPHRQCGSSLHGKL